MFYNRYIHNVRTNEKVLCKLKDINEYFVNIIRSTNLTLYFGKEKRQVLVVNNNFPIPHNGILGKEFLKNNKIAIDYAKNEITSTTTGDNFTLLDHNIQQIYNSIMAVISPSEMIIPIIITTIK